MLSVLNFDVFMFLLNCGCNKEELDDVLSEVYYGEVCGSLWEFKVVVLIKI